jgi:thioredoxin 1
MIMGTVLDLNADNWEQEILKSDILTVVDFWHDRCPWCRQLNPIFNEVSEEYKGKVKFVKLNVLEAPANRQIAIHHGIMSTPTLMFFCEGRPVSQALGSMPKEHLEKLVDDMLQKHRECIKRSTKLEP